MIKVLPGSHPLTACGNGQTRPSWRLGRYKRLRGTTLIEVVCDRVKNRRCSSMLEQQPTIHTDDEILERVRATLVELFEIEPDAITPQARLFDDLEMDSIDVVDLMDQVRRFTGRKVTPEDFRSVRTVADLMTVVRRLQAA